MTVTTDSLIAASGARQRHDLWFYRNATANNASNTFHSMWQSSGLGGSTGTLPTSGVANGRACSKSTAGALLFPNAPTGSWYLQAPKVSFADSAGGVAILVDRLAEFQVANNDSTASVVGCDGTARLAATEGAMILAEVVVGLSAATNTYNLDYTNSAGASKTTPTITTTASQAQCKTVSNGLLWLPLADGDTGVRTITKWTLASGTATGNIAFGIVKPLMSFAIGSTKGIMAERDLFVEVPTAVKIPDTACLHWVVVSGGATTLMNVFGSLGMVAL